MTDKETLTKAIEMAREYYGYNPVGGYLHIVLDDENVEDSNVEFCIKEAKKYDDSEAIALGKFILNMPKAQRIKLVHRYDEYAV